MNRITAAIGVIWLTIVPGPREEQPPPVNEGPIMGVPYDPGPETIAPTSHEEPQPNE